MLGLKPRRDFEMGIHALKGVAIHYLFVKKRRLLAPLSFPCETPRGNSLSICKENLLASTFVIPL